MQSHRLYALTSPQQLTENPARPGFVLTRTQRFQQTTFSTKKSKLALIREHARQSTASITSRHQHKHATMTSITQHWNTITPVKRFYKPTRITPPGGRPTQTAERPGLVLTCEHIDSIYQIFPRHSKTSPYPRTCTEKYRIKNVSSPA